MYLQDVFTDDTFFKDHAILAATFHSLSKPPLLPMWRQPKPIDWALVPDVATMPTKVTSSADMDQRYTQIFQLLKEFVDAKLAETQKPSLLPAQRGRARTTEIHWIQERSQPPKPGRHGERQPTYHGIDPTHCRWLRQARRFRNLAKLLQKPQLHPSQQQHATRLWYSITKAPGFNSGFVGWWNHQHGHRAAITFHTPTPSRAAVVADGCFGPV